MDSDRESERLFSLLLSRVMADIGVNNWMIDSRRRSYLKRDIMRNAYNYMRNVNSITYMVGSQTEGTTTLGMESDIDTLARDDTVHVILVRNKWQKGKPNFLVLKDEQTPPQHCYLQILRSDLPLPKVQPQVPNEVLDGANRVLMSNISDEVYQWLKIHNTGEVTRHGPAFTFDGRNDYVKSYHCDQLPEECKFMFQRPRPGHWPGPDTLAIAKEAGVFLVPQGYTESPAKEVICKSTALLVPSELTSYPHSKWQWRFSTTLMERFLMFGLSPVQVKTYTLAKIIRKTLFEPEFGDRLSTFHIKTAMMFTIENYPATIWRKDNIVKCVCLLFNTLKRWVKQKYCPHFTISGVNLFVGKLNLWELPKLCKIISNLISTKLQCLYNTNMDNIGLRLRQRANESGQNVETRTQICSVILRHLLHEEEMELVICINILIADNSVDGIFNNLLMLKKETETELSQPGKEVLSMLIPFLQGTLASMLASRCISLGQPITEDILNRYKKSLDSDLMSSWLKFASMLYCSRQYDEAAEVLTYCEGLLVPEVVQFCGHYGREYLEPSTGFDKKLITLSTLEVLKKHTMLCTTFTKEELNCIPQQLSYEMNRSFNAQETYPMKNWKANVVTDCIPFLYYLQHLTFRELHQSCREQTALHNLHRQGAQTALCILHRQREQTALHKLHRKREQTAFCNLHRQRAQTALRNLHRLSEQTALHKLHRKREQTALRYLHRQREQTALCNLHKQSEQTALHNLNSRREQTALCNLHRQTKLTALCNLHRQRAKSALRNLHRQREQTAIRNLHRQREQTALCNLHRQREQTAQFNLERQSEQKALHYLHRQREQTALRNLHRQRAQTALCTLHKQRAQTALQKLHQYTMGKTHGHIDTAFNMLGHCYELQNRLDQARICYSKSMGIYEEENASIWHAARIGQS